MLDAESKDVTRRAEDLADAESITLDQALEIVTSLWVGSTEAARRLGVPIDDTTNP